MSEKTFEEKIAELDFESQNVPDFNIPDWPLKETSGLFLGYKSFRTVKIDKGMKLKKKRGFIWVEIDENGYLYFHVFKLSHLVFPLMIPVGIIGAIVLAVSGFNKDICFFGLFLAMVGFVMTIILANALNSFIEDVYLSKTNNKESKFASLFLFNQSKETIYQKIKANIPEHEEAREFVQKSLKEIAPYIVLNELDK